MTIYLSDNKFTYSTKAYEYARFDQFVTTHCPGITPDEAMQLVSKGKECFTQLIAHAACDTLPELKQLCKDPSELLTPFIWYLMFQAVQRGEGFTQGTFVIKDPNHTFQRFFSSSKYTYRRVMSHFLHRTQRDPLTKGYGNTYAIDTACNAKTVLPANKKTVIWSQIKTLEADSYTFFKIEDWGFSGLSSSLRHARDFLLFLPRLCFPSLFGKHYKIGYREEHTPPDITKKFFRYLQVDKATRVKIAHYGLAAISESLQMAATINSKAKQLLSELILAYPDLKQTHVRTGREVLFYDLHSMT